MSTLCQTLENRRRSERRRFGLYTWVYGALRARRRAPRRIEDSSGWIADHHEPHRMATVLLILLLSWADAMLTLTLLERGAVEINPFMALLIEADLLLFGAVKMALTGAGLVVLVALANFHVFGRLRVAYLLHMFLPLYLALFLYELALLTGRGM